MMPRYDIDKIKFATDRPTFERAIDLYESGKVTQFKEGFGSYSAVVLGGKPYNVVVSAKHYGHARCDCYVGRQDTLCKHMVAAAIYVVMRGMLLSEDDKQITDQPACSGQPGILNKEELATAKKSIAAAIRFIKPYNGPSKLWFAYQNSLSEGCNRLSSVVSILPVSEQTARLLVNVLLRLDKKLCVGGVDDSDGTVGGFIEATVAMLKEFNELDPNCGKAFNSLCKQSTCFGWEEPLVKIIDEQE
ncbi:hypothetical protein KJ854_04660 [Patescibacteria group bacterium]|nr:hypothetical protein [Patescibacteria group bacterium]